MPEMKRKKPYFNYSQMTLLLGGSIDKNIRITKSLIVWMQVMYKYQLDFYPLQK